MELAAKRAGRNPRVVVTDKLKAYIDGIELAYGADSSHRQGGPFDVTNNTNLIERFHGSLKSRTKVMRGLKNLDSTKLFTDGWLAYYNFLRPHMSLNGRTPAQAAGIKYPFTSWGEFIGVNRQPELHTEILKGTTLKAVKYGVNRARTKRPAKPVSGIGEAR